MSELIDRQALIKQLKEENIPFNADINEIINIQPIAFDVDNIVKKLEEIKGKACDGIECVNCVYSKDCYEGEMSEIVAIDKAINIVKQEINNGLE